MDRLAFETARTFIARDIGRELELAKASKARLEDAGVTPGGANLMAALALLCYTEFAGKLKYACRKSDGRDASAENFNRFFDDLGAGYASLRKAVNVYDVFRCGLAHEYFVKRDCEISMFGSTPTGIVQRTDGSFAFVVEAYLRDFLRAFDELGQQLFPNGERPA